MLQRTAAVAFAACMFVVGGCATVPVEDKPPAIKSGGTAAAAPYGFYHKVSKGQTLWRISRMYGVDVDELTQYNSIREDAPIEIGQLILVPRLKTESGSLSAVKDQSGRTSVRPPTVEDQSGRTSVRSSALSDAIRQDDFIWPLKGKVVSTFGQVFESAQNRGIVIEPRGSRDVVAARAGKVVFFAESFGIYGRTVIIEHGDGLSTVYARAAEVFVKPGDIVQRGMRIARVGSGHKAYLQFQVRKKSAAQNPLYYLP